MAARRARDHQRRCARSTTARSSRPAARKGGMTAIYHRRFYPDDVDGTVPYVAPISFGAPDLRYAAVPRHDRPADVPAGGARRRDRDAREPPRRADSRARRTQATAERHRVHADPARARASSRRSSASSGRSGSTTASARAARCRRRPRPTTSCGTFLDEISPVADNDDERIAQFDAYYYQAYFAARLSRRRRRVPRPVPDVHRRRLRRRAADARSRPTTAARRCTTSTSSCETEGDRLLFVYGEWDPWTGGKFELGNATDSLRS